MELWNDKRHENGLNWFWFLLNRTGTNAHAVQNMFWSITCNIWLDISGVFEMCVCKVQQMSLQQQQGQRTKSCDWFISRPKWIWIPFWQCSNISKRESIQLLFYALKLHLETCLFLDLLKCESHSPFFIFNLEIYLQQFPLWGGLQLRNILWSECFRCSLNAKPDCVEIELRDKHVCA